MLPLLRVLKRKAHFVGEDRRGDYGRVSARNIRAERMTSSVPLPFMEETPASAFNADAMSASYIRRNRRSDKYHAAVGSNDTGRVHAVNREGLSGVAACMVLTVLVCTLGIACLVGRSHVIETGKEVSRMESRIAELSRMNEELERQLADSASEVNVGYEAVQMGMISARGVDVIYLSAPEAANMTIANVDNMLAGERFATILGD